MIASIRIEGGYSDRHRVFVTFLNPDGFVPREDVIVSVGPGAQVNPSAAHGGGVTLVAWSERRADGKYVLRTRPFDANGTPIAQPSSMPFAGPPQRSSVAFNGETFFVVWSEGPRGTGAIYGARITARGAAFEVQRISSISGAGRDRSPPTSLISC